MFKYLTILFPVLIAAILSSGCEQPVQPATTETPKVRAVHPAEREVADCAYFTGRTAAAQSVEVQSRVTGYLESIDFEPGAKVKAGARLFKIDPRPYQATLDAAEGQVRLAEARLQLAEANYRRSLEVAKTPGAITQQEIDRDIAHKSESEAAVAAAKANSESAKLNLEFTDIISPIDGVVGRDLLTVGNLVTQDNTLLTTVVSQDPIHVYFDVDERTILRVERLVSDGKIPTEKEEQVIPVQLGLADEGSEFPHEGRIDFINNQLDTSMGTVQVRGEFPNPEVKGRNIHLLRPGLFVRVRLPIGPPYKALVVPQAAVGADLGRKYLLVVGEGNVVEYRPVTLGPEQADGMQVVFPEKMVRTADGLRPAGEGDPDTIDSITAADQVIVGGLQRVHPGMKVEVRDDSDGNP
ncbi:MAG: efflux RND transporter periplasmic adaptor subunit [Planctomycetaceae bacterium]|nr:efflux RND transporter periplasmic adaptor subunit [Planctomycetaceae bacterium]